MKMNPFHKYDVNMVSNSSYWGGRFHCIMKHLLNSQGHCNLKENGFCPTSGSLPPAVLSLSLSLSLSLFLSLSFLLTIPSSFSNLLTREGMAGLWF